MSESGKTVQSLETALPDPAEADDVIYDPSMDRLREFSDHLETTTEFGSPSYVSDERSRNADRTKNAVDDDFDADDYARIERAFDAAREREMVCVDRRMGRDDDHSYVCRLYVPREYGRIALAWAKLFEPVTSDGDSRPDPDFVTVQIPDADEIAVRILPDEGVTAVLGSDYTGEAKKSFLRLFMYYAKKQGGLGLHAGSKRVRLTDESGDLKEVGQAFLGLSATGKSTLTAHGLWLDDPEEATMLQDDVCALLPDGTIAGSEGNGLYVKTIGLDADEQPAMYDAVTDESAVLENVDVADDGTVDFDSDRYTTNGRAVIEREQLSSADEDIDLDGVDQVFFITRNPVMPPVAKLSPEEAAAAFMLGESIQTSAGDPSKAGESIRVVGTNPFIVGSKGEEGNRFRDLVADLDVDCFVINTGHLGAKQKDIGVEESVTILREIARGTVEWTDDEATGLTIPSAVPGMDIAEFDVAENVANLDEKLARLRTERRTHLDTFEDLDDAIRDAVY
ncbi:phosphoenolpyruvate carboxykinase (ATP) [Halorussus sp. MSC15.2]|uniref:phosphoenolpyruvate carboxykinase (ATP) n=1 Tax=Halorussus sp. MSC15.2 TaxID=2283638 RepID=UPI0013D062BA|nr:phosphoenolpyruvate carboxykinase (ATP) [Halorussus sp. MSC15.2]NEU57036.1 phosphoenolpyruvate carboxykinase (ATP) [Halorussus sp. MSC15.2]